MNTIRTITCLLTILLLGSSCGNEEDNTSERFNILTANGGVWEVDKFQRKSADDIDWGDLTNDCNNDDTWEFSPSGELTIYSGTELCSVGDNAEPTTNTFSLAANDTKIIIEINGQELDRSIELLTSEQLIVTYAVNNLSNSQGRTIYSKN